MFDSESGLYIENLLPTKWDQPDVKNIIDIVPDLCETKGGKTFAAARTKL